VKNSVVVQAGNSGNYNPVIVSTTATSGVIKVLTSHFQQMFQIFGIHKVGDDTVSAFANGGRFQPNGVPAGRML
jgi:hypothetical protein